MKKLYVIIAMFASLFQVAAVFGQTDACITWDLLSTDSVTSVVGNITGQPESIGVGSSSPVMSVYGYNNGQELWVGNAGGTWVPDPPDTPMLDLMRYVEFNTSPQPGNSFTITDVSFNYGDFPLGIDLDILNFQAFYSMDNWANSTVLNLAPLSYLNTAMSSFTRSISGVVVPDGHTFSLRIYPYPVLHGSAMTPTFAIHNNVVICGTTVPEAVDKDSICGIKFNDLNGDGIQDAGEPGLPNWTINLSGSATMTTVTDETGHYCFTNVEPGRYTVSEIYQTGWRQTAPYPSTYSFELASDQTLTDMNFGNIADPAVTVGSICGMKFNDLNGNGVQDASEPGLPNWQINLAGSANMTAVTDEKGNYCFTNLKPGRYTISEVYQTGWLQTPYPSTYTVVLESGRNLTEINFGNMADPTVTLGSICGIKFNDLNGDGVQNAGEPGLPNWQIDMGGPIDLSVTTDERGNYCFDHLPAGTYKITEENQNGWLQTVPSEDHYIVTLESGQNLTDINFGNHFDETVKVGAVCGIKFNDINGNGVQDAGEPGLPNWQINLTGAATKTAITDERGNYCFTNLKPGTYSITEVNQTGWLQTAPDSPGTYTITIASGQNVSSQNFGNKYEIDCISPPKGMVGWWPGDNNANDISGLNNNGTLQGGTTYMIGKVTNAFNVNTVTDYVSIPDNSALNFGRDDFSIDAWVKTINTSGNLSIVYKAVQSDPFTNPNSVGYALSIVQGGILNFHMGEGSVFMNYPATTVQIADGEWHFVAVTVDRNNTTGGKLYVDGNMVLTFDPTSVSNSITNTSPFFIAKREFNPVSADGDQIDEVEIFNRVLTDIEISSIFNAGSAGKCKSSVQLGSICGIKFNDLNGNGVQDSRGDGEPGLPDWYIKLTGAATLNKTTDAIGYFCFNNLLPGQYAIAEVMQPGWYQTVPLSPSTYTVTLAPGQHIDPLYFGNKFDPCVNGTKSWRPLGDGTNGSALGGVYAIAVSGTDIYACGNFTTAGGVSANNIAKWDGTNWSALENGISGTVYALAVMGGELYAAGNFTTAGGVGANNIAKWDGTSWSTLGSGISIGVGGGVHALVVMGGDLYAAGNFTTAGGVSANNIAKWNGTNWSTLGSGTTGSLYALAVNGTDLYAGGIFFSAGGANISHIAQWNGTNWSPLGIGTDSTVKSLAVMGGELYAGGDFSFAGGVSANRIAKWDGTNWSPLGSGMNTEYVRFLAVNGTSLYAGGGFTTSGGVTTNYIAKWDGTNWSALGSGMNSLVHALAVNGSDLYAGGGFTTTGGVSANHVAKYICSIFDPGDINGDGRVDLKDEILALKVLSNMSSAGIRLDHSAVDVNGDGKVGIHEVIFILDKEAGLK